MYEKLRLVFFIYRTRSKIKKPDSDESGFKTLSAKRTYLSGCKFDTFSLKGLI